MKPSNDPRQRLNDIEIQQYVNYRENKYIFAIKDSKQYSGNWVNVHPVLFVNDDDFWGVDKDEIKRINISPCKELKLVNHELVILGWKCYQNTNENTMWLYSHYIHEKNVYEIDAGNHIMFDVFSGQIDYSNCSVSFNNDFNELFQKYIETKNRFYIKDNDNIVGPFVMQSYNGNTYNIRRYNRLTVKKAQYNDQYVFAPDVDEYTNRVERFFLLEEDIELLFENAESVDFVSDFELFEWARSEYEKNISQNILQKDSISLLYQWIDRIPEIEKQTNRYRRLEFIKSTLGSYEESISKFISLIPDIGAIKSEIEKIENRRVQLESDKNKLEGDILTLKNSHSNNQQLCDELQSDIDKLEAKKSEYQKELEVEYIQQQQELINEIETLTRERDTLSITLDKEREEQRAKVQKEIEGLKIKAELIRDQKNELETAKLNLQKEFTDAQSEANRILSDLVKSKTHFDFIRGKRFSDSDNDSSQYSYNYVGSSEEDFKSYEDLRNRIIAILNSQGRKCDEHFVDNLLISTTQNLFTLFVGLPGTGKTSMARILGSCISGKDRFAEVSVGRGWTSHKDLLGFYNPLSGNFVESHKGLHNKLQDLNYEMKNDLSNNSPILYILLDEANLSPIEHYWSMFINDTDRNYEDVFEIDLGNGGLLNHKNAIRFIGTLNNDHTTEKISPRILDRVNLIYFKPEEVDQFATSQVLEELRISKRVMEKFCLVTGDRESDYSLDARLNDQKELYKKIKNHLKDYMNIFLSPRIDKAMERYCEVANRTMAEKHRPLDYFVAQRILPLISNSRKEHLSTLMDILCDFNLSKPISTTIVEQIIKKGEENFDMYDYFSIIG